MRDLKIDNAKGVLIVLVVFGHLLEFSGGWRDPLLSLVLTAIYMFHMPAFIFLSGMTAKADGLARRLATLLIILVAFQGIYVGVVMALTGGFAGNLLQPYWLLWFLLSMIWWVALLPAVQKIPFSLAISIAIALGAGLIPWAGYPLSIARTLVFLPFFVAGAIYGKQVWSFMSLHNPLRYAALLLLPVIAVAIHQYGVSNVWLYGSFRFDQLNVSTAPGIVTRAALILAASAASLAMFATIPSAKTIITKAGRNSLSVFVLHGLIVIAAGPLISSTVAAVGPWVGLLVLGAAALVIVAILSADFLDSAIRKSAQMVYGGLASLIIGNSAKANQ